MENTPTAAAVLQPWGQMALISVSDFEFTSALCYAFPTPGGVWGMEHLLWVQLEVLLRGFGPCFAHTGFESGVWAVELCLLSSWCMGPPAIGR